MKNFFRKNFWIYVPKIEYWRTVFESLLELKEKERKDTWKEKKISAIFAKIARDRTSHLPRCLPQRGQITQRNHARCTSDCNWTAVFSPLSFWQWSKHRQRQLLNQPPPLRSFSSSCCKIQRALHATREMCNFLCRSTRNILTPVSSAFHYPHLRRWFSCWKRDSLPDTSRRLFDVRKFREKKERKRTVSRVAENNNGMKFRILINRI